MKYIIQWNAGFGPGAEVVEAKTLEEAEQLAYEQWKEEAEQDAEHEAVVWTQELEDELC